MRRSRYSLLVDGDAHIVFVIDQCRPDCLSVANDAENVVGDLVRLGIDVDRYRIIYRDSTGTWDGMDTRAAGDRCLQWYGIVLWRSGSA